MALAPVPNTDDARISFALAGDRVLLARGEGREVRVVELAASGGGRAVQRLRTRVGTGRAASPRLSATSEIAGLVLRGEGQVDGAGTSSQVFASAPREAFTPLGSANVLSSAESFFAALLQADGNRLFVQELRADFGAARYTVREPGGTTTLVDIPNDAGEVRFAGDLVAYAVPAAGQPQDDDPRRLVVREWRSGAERYSVSLPAGVRGLDLRADGRAVVGEEGGGILVVAPGGTPARRLATSGSVPRWAGERIVYIVGSEREGDEALRVVDPSGRRRALGVPSAEVAGFDVDAQRVAFVANGCLISTALTAPPAGAVGPGPCPRTEMFFDDEGDTPVVGPDRRVGVLLRCVAAPPTGCRGSVTLSLEGFSFSGRISAPARFRIAPGSRRSVRVRLTRAGYARAAREDREGIGGGFAASLRAVTVDPAGRVSVLSDGVAIDIPGGPS